LAVAWSGAVAAAISKFCWVAAPKWLLDELSVAERPRWTLVDAAWTRNSAIDVSKDNETIC
jgi:hypothetical protein